MLTLDMREPESYEALSFSDINEVEVLIVLLRMFAVVFDLMSVHPAHGFGPHILCSNTYVYAVLMRPKRPKRYVRIYSVYS